MVKNSELSDAEKLTVARLKDKLAHYAYNGDELGKIWVGPASKPIQGYRFRDNNPRHTLIRLFLIGLEGIWPQC